MSISESSIVFLLFKTEKDTWYQVSVMEGSGVIGCNIILEDGIGGTFYFRKGIKHWSYRLTIGGLIRDWTRVSYDRFDYKLLNYILDNYE